MSHNVKFDVFLSHNRADKRYAAALVAELRSRSVSVFFDDEQILPGDDIVLLATDVDAAAGLGN